jgi:Ion channel
MQASTLPADAPRWRRHMHPDGYAYGWLLLLTLSSLAFQLGAPDTEAARLMTIALQSATLLGALHVSGAHRWLVRLAAAATVLALLATAIASIGSSEVGEEGARSVGLLLVLLAPAAIVRGIVRQAREHGAITIRTMFGVLCVYLLVGMAFAFAYGAIAAIGDEPFFAEISGGTQSDFLYFSFTTLTTTGFGDLTAAYDLGRSLAVTEALVGQIYLVTVVALIVGNIGAQVRRPAQ